MQEIKVIKKALEKHGAHQERTVQELDISRLSVQYKFKKLGLINN
ncbi:helix-turn-helix domain-containing protein [Anaeromicrobium sediminis]